MPEKRTVCLAKGTTHRPKGTFHCPICTASEKTPMMTSLIIIKIVIFLSPLPAVSAFRLIQPLWPHRSFANNEKISRVLIKSLDTAHLTQPSRLLSHLGYFYYPLPLPFSLGSQVYCRIGFSERWIKRLLLFFLFCFLYERLIGNRRLGGLFFVCFLFLRVL